jgi:mutator protein MutT
MHSGSESTVTHVGLAVILRDGEVLVARRHRDAPLGGLWEFPGGKVRPGESVPACVEREVEEEVGVQVRSEPPFMTAEHQYAHARVRLSCCRCTLIAGEPQALECAEVRWVPLVELPQYDFPEANASLLTGLTQLACPVG